MFRPIAVRHSPACRGPNHADMIAATQARGIGPGRPLSRRSQRDLLRQQTHRCHLADPRGGSPDMGRVSADGRMLWLTGRYHGFVYGFDTRRGRLVARIPVCGSPHGMAVWPQPGRYRTGPARARASPGDWQVASHRGGCPQPHSFHLAAMAYDSCLSSAAETGWSAGRCAVGAASRHGAFQRVPTSAQTACQLH
jgi:hypothetical protein